MVSRDARRAWENKLRHGGVLPAAERVVDADRAGLLAEGRDVPCRLLLSSDAVYVMANAIPACSPALRLPFDGISGVLALRLREPILVIKRVGARDGEFLELRFRSGASDSFLDRFEGSLPGRWVTQRAPGRPAESDPPIGRIGHHSVRTTPARRGLE